MDLALDYWGGWVWRRYY